MSTRAKARTGAAAKRASKARGGARKAAPTRMESAEMASAKIVDTMKDLVHAQLGAYGEIYDELNARITKAKTETPARYRRLVRRGERVQKDLQKAQADLKKNLEKARSDLKTKLDRMQDNLRRKVESIQGS